MQAKAHADALAAVAAAEKERARVAALAPLAALVSGGVLPRVVAVNAPAPRGPSIYGADAHEPVFCRQARRQARGAGGGAGEQQRQPRWRIIVRCGTVTVAKEARALAAAVASVLPLRPGGPSFPTPRGLALPAAPLVLPGVEFE